MVKTLLNVGDYGPGVIEAGELARWPKNLPSHL
jgi:hypothetical protein